MVLNNEHKGPSKAKRVPATSGRSSRGRGSRGRSARGRKNRTNRSQKNTEPSEAAENAGEDSDEHEEAAEVMKPSWLLREAMRRKGLSETGVFDVIAIGEVRNI